MKKQVATTFKFIAGLTLLIAVIGFFIQPDVAFANSYYAGTDETGRSYDVSSFMAGIKQIYDIAKMVILPLGAVAIIMGAYQLLMGDEESASKGKTQIAIAIVTVMVFFLLPTVVKFGVELGRQYGWTPTIDESNTFETELVTGDDSEEGEEDEKADEEQDKENTDKNEDSE